MQQSDPEVCCANPFILNLSPNSCLGSDTPEKFHFIWQQVVCVSYSKSMQSRLLQNCYTLSWFINWNVETTIWFVNLVPNCSWNEVLGLQFLKLCGHKQQPTSVEKSIESLDFISSRLYRLHISHTMLLMPFDAPLGILQNEFFSLLFVRTIVTSQTHHDRVPCKTVATWSNLSKREDTLKCHISLAYSQPIGRVSMQ